MKNIIPSVDFKLPGTRKVRNFVIYPSKEEDIDFILQSEDAIIALHKQSGLALYNVTKSHPGTWLLHTQYGAKRDYFPKLLALVREAMNPVQGKELTLGGVIRVQY
jgi:hypothetical protein